MGFAHKETLFNRNSCTYFFIDSYSATTEANVIPCVPDEIIPLCPARE
jgi:hypothetical protein